MSKLERRTILPVEARLVRRLSTEAMFSFCFASSSLYVRFTLALIPSIFAPLPSQMPIQYLRLSIFCLSSRPDSLMKNLSSEALPPYFSNAARATLETFGAYSSLPNASCQNTFSVECLRSYIPFSSFAFTSRGSSIRSNDLIRPSLIFIIPSHHALRA